ncbi:Uncharacterised protein [Klebsiella pneumoniae]|uniref:Uncharacterized protein n=1 Tax=Klebsiella pneumoniae TaxID=573 RepID=A0A378G0A5_KLEPN|nr:Uncharacterised protein [Klebsiella pneumoniae]
MRNVKKLNRQEVGWGRFPHELSEVIFCGDDEVKVIYQGKLKPSQHMRALIPVPEIPMKGRVNLRGNILFLKSSGC